MRDEGCGRVWKRNTQTFADFLNEIVYDEAEDCHQYSQDQDEEPVYDIGEDVGGRVLPHPCTWSFTGWSHVLCIMDI